MKRKTNVSLVCKICILFTAAILLSVSLFFWLASNVAVHEDAVKTKVEIAVTKPPTVVVGKNQSLSQTPGTSPRNPVQITQPVSQTQVATGDTIHFIHIPKCGGTTMTTLLRQIQCTADPVRNADCCLNPGFCDWHAHRRCSTIMGCINHFPNR
jgi:hypothetical protein